MKLAIASMTMIFVPISMSYAEEVNKFDNNTMARSVQCEFGRAAEKFPPQRWSLKGKLTLERVNYRAKEVTTAAGLFGWSTKVTYTDEYTDTEGGEFLSTFNLHPDNKVVCKFRNIVELNIDKCLLESADLLNEQNGQIKCAHEATGTLKVEAGVERDIWIVNASVDGSYAKKSTYKVGVLLPPETTSPKPALTASPAAPPPAESARGSRVSAVSTPTPTPTPTPIALQSHLIEPLSTYSFRNALMLL